MAEPVGKGIHRFRRALEGLLGVPATEGNRVEVLRNGDEIFPAMLGAIREATSTIDFLTFVYWTGEIDEEWGRALAERAEQGVRVRVLLDALGSYTMEEQVIEVMEKGGVLVERFRPVQKLRFWETDHRTHRKVLICDEDIAFSGGVGIADEWRGDARDESEWRDTHFRIRGPAVDGLRSAFVQNWAETGHPLFDDGVDRFPEQPTDGPTTIQVLRGSAGGEWSDIASLFRALLRLAKERVRITTAYFVPDDETSARALAEIGPLIEAGVKVWAFQPSMLHAKVMTVDGLVANVGSANFDARSLLRDEEVNMVIYDPEITTVLDRHFEDDLRRSHPFDPEEWARRGPVQRVKEAVTDLFQDHL